MKHKQLYRKQRGGVIPIGDPVSAFNKFFTPNETTSVYYLSRGVEGLTFMVTNEDSDYYAFRPASLGDKITRVVVKIALLHTENEIIYNARRMKSVSKDDFNNEVELQQRAVETTIGFFEPVSPTIVYWSNQQNIGFINMLLRLNPDAYTYDELEKYKLDVPNGKGAAIGVIVMECAGFKEHFRGLHNNLNAWSRQTSSGSPNDDTYYALTAFELFRLAYEGFSQGDFHIDNIMMSNNYPGYFVSDDQTWYKDKRALILDWGRGNELSTAKFYKLPGKGETEYDAREAFIFYYETFIETGDFKSYQQCIFIIVKSGSFKRHKPIAADVTWFSLYCFGNKTIMNYIRELHHARERGKKQTIEDTREYVVKALGTIDPEKRELFEKNYEQLQVVCPELIAFVVNHVKSIEKTKRLYMPPMFVKRASELQHGFFDVNLLETPHPLGIQKSINQRQPSASSDLSTSYDDIFKMDFSPNKHDIYKPMNSSNNNSSNNNSSNNNSSNNNSSNNSSLQDAASGQNMYHPFSGSSGGGGGSTIEMFLDKSCFSTAFVVFVIVQNTELSRIFGTINFGLTPQSNNAAKSNYVPEPNYVSQPNQGFQEIVAYGGKRSSSKLSGRKRNGGKPKYTRNKKHKTGKTRRLKIKNVGI